MSDHTIPDPHPALPFLTPRVRAWLYRVAVAVLALAAFYGLLADESIALWVGLVAAFLGSGTAALHTPTGDEG